MASNGDYDSDSEKINGGPTHYETLSLKEDQEDDLCSKLIPMHNSLVDVFSAVDNREEEFNLPEIVVVGPQSAGKSSVLESLVNRQFLPRGDGLVTRCPIELRLNQTKNASEWVEFGHDMDIPKKKWPFNKVGKEIAEQTIRLAGSNKGIVNVPIQVSVYSPNVIPLTVVDLPGIVKNSTGDQPETIEEQINELIYEYVSKPSSIILAISAANNDIATSESLKVARSVDPSGERTLGVITKLDKAERDNTELSNLLSGRIISLKYGFIGVRNQSPEDLRKKKPMNEIRHEEERLLQEIVPELATRNGTKYLAQKLSQLLVRHICKRLPMLENKISEQIKLYGDKIQSLGSDDIPNKSKTMSTTIDRFCRKFIGEFEGNSRNINTIHLSGGARVKFVFLNMLEGALDSVDPLQDITDDEIAKAILSSAAMESSVSVPEAAYQYLVKTQIKKLLPPCLECVRDVHEELQNTIEDCLDSDITFRFPRLTEHLVGAVHKFLSDRLTEVIKILEYHIEIESAFVSTSRQDFRAKLEKLMAAKNITQKGFAESVLSKFGPKTWLKKFNSINQFGEQENVDSYDEPQPTTEGIESFGSTVVDTMNTATGTLITTGNIGATAAAATAAIVGGTVDALLGKNKKVHSNHQAKNSNTTMMNDRDIVRSLIRAYFEIVRQSIRDFVPKLLTYTMIYYSCDNLHVFLNEHLHSSEKIDDLVRVSEEASKQRIHARTRLEQLKKGEEIIKEFRRSVNF